MRLCVGWLDKSDKDGSQQYEIGKLRSGELMTDMRSVKNIATISGSSEVKEKYISGKKRDDQWKIKWEEMIVRMKDGGQKKAVPRRWITCIAKRDEIYVVLLLFNYST